MLTSPNILCRFQRPPGAVSSPMLGLEAVNDSLDAFGFENFHCLCVCCCSAEHTSGVTILRSVTEVQKFVVSRAEGNDDGSNADDARRLVENMKTSITEGTHIYGELEEGNEYGNVIHYLKPPATTIVFP
ncbi:hypothetical protein C5167_005879 [Papaver somniferum]|uniref:Uncharacterized protein n=1 Tax=Papaver somniferum TaxID=3469 RepID=A0A4Y7JBU9_PAPSO|nr:hypothetical protein C5167_005879 [Papaver somniferum]